MYKTLLSIILIMGGLFVYAPAFAQSATESVLQFDTTATIAPDASVHVQEHIVYDFGTAQRHGIYRTIPVRYQTQTGNITITLSDITVADQVGKQYAFSTSFSGNDEEIKIGDANVLLSGTKTYVVSYTVSRAIGYFNDHDELYWNVTGNGWQVPVSQASAHVVLPAQVAQGTISADCFVGLVGSAEACGATIIGAPNETAGTAQNIYFTQQQVLAPGSGLTIAVGFPKGLVQKVPWYRSAWAFVVANPIVGLPAIVLVVMSVLWWYKGRDPRGRGTIVPEYEAPDNLTPIEMDALLHGSVKSSAISAEIIYLATRGYIHISQISEKILFLSHTDYRLQKLKEADDSLPEFDKLVLAGLFENGDTNLSDLKKHFYTKIGAIKKSVMSSLVQKKYFAVSPNTVRGTYIAVAVAMFAVVYVAAQAMSIVVAISIALCAAIVLLFGLVMPKVTTLGAIAREKIKGLKMYMEVAEKDRINFHNAPEKKPEVFEMLLPFAMVLGVEKAWAQQFEGIYTQNPGWYSGGTGPFMPVVFVGNLHSFSAAASSTLTSAPSGGSGVGGGGFSGGGFGGGGGGSW
jgi:uncharacterized membrane protein YgcG